MVMFILYYLYSSTNRENLWNSERTSWFSLYPVHRKSTDGNESRAYLCMHESEKTSEDTGYEKWKLSAVYA